MIPQHLSKTWEHYTPPHVVEAARKVLGTIDLDPASCEEANKTVRATRIISLPEDGLSAHWTKDGTKSGLDNYASVFLNPPGGALTTGGKRRQEMWVAGATVAQTRAEEERVEQEVKRWETRSRACAWWRKLSEEYAAGRVGHAIFVGFTLELLRSAQGGGGKWSHPFDHAVCVPSERLAFSGDQPTHANVIVYLGPSRDAFWQAFSPIGRVR